MQGPGCKVNGAEVPSCSSESSPCREQQCDALCVVLQDDLFLPWMFVTKCMTKLLEHLTVTSSIDGFLVTKIQPICILQQPRRQFPWSTGLRTLFLASFSSAVLCDAIPCSVILFLDHSNANSFHHPPRCCEERCYL